MSQYDNTNRGAIFKNDRKESDNHPDYRGQINVGGTEYWVSSWIKVDKNGAKYMSLSVQPKQEQQQDKPQNRAKQQARQQQLPAGNDGFEDDLDGVPF